VIKYIGKLQGICDMCSKYGVHMYKDDKKIMKKLFSEVEWEEQTICEKCAQRESGKKVWHKIKRST